MGGDSVSLSLLFIRMLIYVLVSCVLRDCPMYRPARRHTIIGYEREGERYKTYPAREDWL